MYVRCYKSQFTVGLPTDFIWIVVSIEYANNSAQIPMAKCLFYCKTKRIFMNIKRCIFLDAHCRNCLYVFLRLYHFVSVLNSAVSEFRFINPHAIF